jgi:hypothetical protein
MVVRKIAQSVAILTVVAVLPVITLAGTIGLVWDASPGATGYRVYWGTSPGVYGPNPKDVGNVMETTIDGLSDCTLSYFSVTAYNGVGESPNSNEVGSKPRPSIATASPALMMQGRQGTLTLTGANFEAGATVTVDNANVFLGGVTVTSCNQIQMVATVEPTANGVRSAEVGKFALSVVNSSGLAGNTAQAFEVGLNPARFDFNQNDATTLGRIDGQDVAWISRLFAVKESDPNSNYDPDGDFNGDGQIDGEDFSYVAANFGLCWSGTAWTLAACPADLK